MSLIVCRCDAQASLCIVIEQGFGTNAMDTVLVDMSTLRHTSPGEASKLSVFTSPSCLPPINPVCCFAASLCFVLEMLCNVDQLSR